uniref:Uncharacterized protein n=1 Tax=Panagrolaimus davidi TaxID=227884 RepID=A0A914PSW7_9BILA
MSKENNKAVSRKRKPMEFSYKCDLRYHLGCYVDREARAHQLRREAEERAAKVPKLEEEVKTGKELIQALGKANQKMEQEKKEKEEIYKKWVKTFTDESSAKLEAEKKKVEMLKNVCKRLASRIPKESSKTDSITQTEAATVVECGVQTAFPRTTISTQTSARASPAASFAVGVGVSCPPLKTLPNEVQTKLYLDAMSFATQILQGKEIPPQTWIMHQLIQSWLHFGKQ